MTITKKTVADKIAAYLHHEMTLAQLVDWSENILMDGKLASRDAGAISSVIARLGVADVRAFGLTWGIAKSFSASSVFLRASKWSRRKVRRMGLFSSCNLGTRKTLHRLATQPR